MNIQHYILLYYLCDVPVVAFAIAVLVVSFRAWLTKFVIGVLLIFLLGVIVANAHECRYNPDGSGKPYHHWCPPF